MRQQKSGTKFTLAGAVLLIAGHFLTSSAYAETSNIRKVPHRAAMAQAPAVTKSHSVAKTSHYAARQHATRSYGISCVPFARAESGIVVAGNAWQWWGNAAGTYARGQSPEAGSVLAFRANGRMRMGHVAVVARVLNAREVLIDHANWPIGVPGFQRDVVWSAVRVGLGNDGNFGSVYPTYGFIYDRPDTGVMEANRHTPAQQVAQLNPAPRDLRQGAARPARQFEEVAQAPKARRQVGLIMPRSNVAR